MFRRRIQFWKIKKLNKDIDPDEIFIDSSNLPKFDTDQFEGRIEKAITKRAIYALIFAFIIIGLIFTGRTYFLQISKGEDFALRSQSNNLKHVRLFPERGIISDRNGVELAWNELSDEDFSKRIYLNKSGLSHTLGFISYPMKDSSGFYYRFNLKGEEGVEGVYDDKIGGKVGLKITEIDVFGEIQSESTSRPKKNGESLTLSIDSRVQSKLYEYIKAVAQEAKFQGGAGIIMDVNTGEILALISYPEFDPQIMTDGENEERITGYNSDSRKPFLNRVTSGLYIPGSIVKPFLALGALNEGLIAPSKKILSTGSISVPNPYFPDKETIFKDWKAHGLVNMREAIAVSSNVYFYSIGGGYDGQKGLGISGIEKYLKLFGFGKETDIDFAEEGRGLVPNPKWKAETFDNDDWRIGDTYNTSIGQYGLQITPLQAVRAIAAIANNGKLLEPTILKEDGKVQEEIDIAEEDFEIVKEGMRKSVTIGTARALNVPYIKVAAKTGTAELGTASGAVNSWIIGFFPEESPRFAFAIVLEKRLSSNLVGASFAMKNLIDWMNIYTPEYLKNL
jgi:penicillin-binding protein 2